MNGIITLKFKGGFGNQCVQYLFARGYAESVGADFICPKWIGEEVFELCDRKPMAHTNILTHRSELDYEPGETNIVFDAYAQNERAMTYTREQARKWLNPYHLNPRFTNGELDQWLRPRAVVAHRRVGDYAGYGYPIVSAKSYADAAAEFGIGGNIEFVTEEAPRISKTLPSHLAFVPDFLVLLRASVLFRGNSTFSWLAATLGYGKVYSPVIDDLPAGEHDVRFVEGNHSRLANLDFTREMKLKI